MPETSEKTNLSPDEVTEYGNGAPTPDQTEHRADPAPVEPSPVEPKATPKATKTKKPKKSAEQDPEAAEQKADDVERNTARLAIARIMIFHWNDSVLYDTSTSTWRRWTGCAWVEVEEDSMLQMARDAALRAKTKIAKISENFLKDIIALARLEDGVRRSEWNLQRGAFFKNCWLSIPDLKVHKHDPRNFNTYHLPYDYSETVPFDMWQAHLERTIPDVLGRRALAEHIALSMIGDTTFHKSLVQIGPPRSGKSVNMEIARAALGDYAAETTALLFKDDNEGGKRADRLKDTRLATIDELPPEALEADSMFKRMAAHGPVEVRPNYAPPYEFRWLAKFLFNTNTRPRIYDRSGAVAARLAFIECPNSLLKTPELMDLNLAQKIIDNELPGVARWALMQLPDLFERNQYAESQAMREINHQVMIESNPINAFVEECCVRGADKWVSKTSLWSQWKQWALDSGYQPGGRNKFYGDIVTAGLAVDGRDTVGNTIFMGIGLKI